jgi:hypothetical protein
MASVVLANFVEFVSQDSADRTIIFQHNPGFDDIPATPLPGHANVTVSFQDGWQGNFHAIKQGAPDVTGILGEVCMNCWQGLTYFDISGIVSRVDLTNTVVDLSDIKQLYPKESCSPVSGCEMYDQFCDAAYYNPEDVLTRSTSESTLVCTVGTPETKKGIRRQHRHPHARHMH